jgi:hypothetical protein
MKSPIKDNADKPKNDSIEKSVAEDVLHILGKPPWMTRCIAKRVFEDCFRVNLWGVIESGKYEHVIESFFIHATKGNIIESNPPLKIGLYKPMKKFSGK